MPGKKISIEKINNGDVHEFERLFHAYYARLCTYANSITRNATESEDIISNTFADLWEKHDQLTLHSSLESYMVAAIHHRSVNYLKHIKVEEKYWEEAQYQLNNMDLLHPDPSFNPLSAIITNELSKEIKKAILELPPQCREIFILSKYENLSYQEIADRLGISINTVRTQLTRASKKMRVLLAHYLLFILWICYLLFNRRL